jgi:ribulose-phosphate 3-epimerase
VVIDPATPVAWIDEVLHLVDIILLMTVNPGFGGQSFLPETLPKIAAIRARCAELGLDPHIAADGGQNDETVGATVAAGANVIIAGTSIFGAPDYAAAIAGLRKAAVPGA